MSSMLAEAIGYVAAVVTTLCWVPQAWRSLRTRDVAAISLTAYSAFAAGNVLWLSYGVLIGSAPIVVANAVTLAIVLAIVGAKLRYS
jgi:MtN3 and saliva related transmembrane protein